jgi:hypothetical protein
MIMRPLRDWLKARGPRVITCPETNESEAVRINSLRAAFSGDLRLSSCTRWPERADCAQACLSQIVSSPDGCSVKSLVSSWYEGKACALCSRPIGVIVWHEAPPALLRPDGTTTEWKDVALQDLPHMFETSWPLCWYCNNIEELERMRPVTRRVQMAEKRVAPLKCDNVF